MKWFYPLSIALGEVLDLIAASQIFLCSMHYAYPAKYEYAPVLLRKKIADLLQRIILSDELWTTRGLESDPAAGVDTLILNSHV